MTDVDEPVGKDSLPFTMPFTEELGISIVSADAEQVVGELVVCEALCTTGARMHGGALMAFADSLGAIGAFLALPEASTGTTTIESKTNFVGAAKVNTKVTGVATPVHSGRRTSIWQTRITTEENKLVALVTQTQLVL